MNGFRVRLGVLAIAATSVAMLGLAPSAGAFAWQNPVTASSASDKVSSVGAPRVATDSAGDVMVAWVSNTTVDADQGVQACPCVVRAAFRPAGGSFGAPQTVTPTPIANPDNPLAVTVAMDSGGDAVVGYTAPANPGDANALPDTAYAAIRPAGGSFGAPQVLASPGAPDATASLNFLEMDANGDAIAAINNQQPYTGPDATPDSFPVFDAEVVTGSVGGGFDSAHPQLLSDGTVDAYPQALSISPNGHAVIAIETRVSDQSDSPPPTEPDSVVAFTSDAPGAAFGTPTTIQTVQNPELGTAPEVTAETAARNDAGDYVVGYDDFVNDTTTQARASINGATPADLGGTGSSSPRVVMNPSGESVALVSNVDGDPAVAVRQAGGTSFGAAKTLDGFLYGTLANAANLPSANGQDIMSFDGDDSSSVDASIRPAGGSFPTPTTIAPDNDDPNAFGTDAAIDPAGDAAVTWIGPSNNVRVAIGDASAPTPPPGGGGGGGGGTTAPKIGAPKINSKNGTAKLPVVLDGTGKVVLTGKDVKKVTQTVGSGKTTKVTLLVKPTGSLAKKLKKAGKAKAKVKVTFTPTGGKAASSTKTLKLVEKQR